MAGLGMRDGSAIIQAISDYANRAESRRRYNAEREDKRQSQAYQAALMAEQQKQAQAKAIYDMNYRNRMADAEIAMANAQIQQMGANVKNASRQSDLAEYIAKNGTWDQNKRHELGLDQLNEQIRVNTDGSYMDIARVGQMSVENDQWNRQFGFNTTKFALEHGLARQNSAAMNNFRDAQTAAAEYALGKEKKGDEARADFAEQQQTDANYYNSYDADNLVQAQENAELLRNEIGRFEADSVIGALKAFSGREGQATVDTDENGNYLLSFVGKDGKVDPLTYDYLNNESEQIRVRPQDAEAIIEAAGRVSGMPGNTNQAIRAMIVKDKDGFARVATKEEFSRRYTQWYNKDQEGNVTTADASSKLYDSDGNKDYGTKRRILDKEMAAATERVGRAGKRLADYNGAYHSNKKRVEQASTLYKNDVIGEAEFSSYTDTGSFNYSKAELTDDQIRQREYAAKAVATGAKDGFDSPKFRNDYLTPAIDQSARIAAGKGAKAGDVDLIAARLQQQTTQFLASTTLAPEALSSVKGQAAFGDAMDIAARNPDITVETAFSMALGGFKPGTGDADTLLRKTTDSAENPWSQQDLTRIMIGLNDVLEVDGQKMTGQLRKDLLMQWIGEGASAQAALAQIRQMQ